MGKVSQFLRKIGLSSKPRSSRKGGVDENEESSSDMVEIPKKIHHFWQGDVNLLREHVPNLNEIASMNSNYKIRLHILPSENENLEMLESQLEGIKVKDITKEKWFHDFKKSPRASQFDASRTGARPHLASGADILKSELIYRKGGIWNDVDNKPLKGLPNELKVPKGKLLIAGPVKFVRWGGVVGFHSSTFAAHKKNELLKQLNISSLEKFNNVRNEIYKKNSITDDPDKHFQMISETAGSLHFSKELMERDESLKSEVMDLYRTGEVANNSLVIFDNYFKPTTTTGVGNIDEVQTMKAFRMVGGGIIAADYSPAQLAAIVAARKLAGKEVHIVI